MTTKPENLAYHEGGHVVMAYVVHRRFKYASVEPGKDHKGLASFQDPGKWLESDMKPMKPRSRNEAEKEILCILAGSEALKLFTGTDNLSPSDVDSCTGDYEAALHVARSVCEEPEELSAYVEWLTLRTRNILRTTANWNRVRAVARELVKTHRIGYIKARKIIRRTDSSPVST